MRYQHEFREVFYDHAAWSPDCISYLSAVRCCKQMFMQTKRLLPQFLSKVSSWSMGLSSLVRHFKSNKSNGLTTKGLKASYKLQKHTKNDKTTDVRWIHCSQQMLTQFILKLIQQSSVILFRLYANSQSEFEVFSFTMPRLYEERQLERYTTQKYK